MEDTGVVDRFLHAIESATIGDCQVWSAEARLDATVPNWRLHANGADAIRAEYAKWFADPGHFDELNRYLVGGNGGDDGASELIEYTLSWQEDGVPHAAHHMHLLTVKDGFIVSDKVFCGGRWPASLLADMEAAGA
ncbi:MAG TPA: hypothetical protein VEV63_07115 [Streptosporangiaceae bacterium]|nr:hypothetical protein [Streptosporangiaceae bacterium]